jgi:hypothetical protein
MLAALRAKVIWIFRVLPGVGPLTGQPQANFHHPVGVIRMRIAWLQNFWKGSKICRASGICHRNTCPGEYRLAVRQ